MTIFNQRNLGVPENMANHNNRRKSFAASLQEHIENWRSDVDGSRSRMWDHWTDGIYPEHRSLAQEMVKADSVKFHNYIAHLRSSQAFAFNLFLPFRGGSRSGLSDRVSELVDVPVSIEQVHFEWVPPGSILGEVDGDRPSDEEVATGADVVLWCRREDGSRAAVLLEVKLSETNFTHCNGRTSPANRRTDVCESARLFFEDPSACYLRRPIRKRRDRRYWEIFTASHGSVGAAFPGADLSGPCPFAYDMQQPMRNLAIARGLEQEGVVEQSWFVLCSHDLNPNISEHWEAWGRLLPDSDTSYSLLASEIVRVGEAEGASDWAAWMRRRYMLP